MLLEVFPTCSMEQAQWVLAKARGDLEEAVQMLVEDKEGRPPGWDSPSQVSSLSLSTAAPGTSALLGFPVKRTPYLSSSLPLLLPMGLE